MTVPSGDATVADLRWGAGEGDGESDSTLFLLL